MNDQKIPPCPNDAELFWDDRVFRFVPVKTKHTWMWSNAFKQWRCLVEFQDGHKTYTSPHTQSPYKEN